MRYKLSPRAQRQMETKWALRDEAIELLRLVVAEWKSDPMSVQCFDLRTVERAKQCIASLDALPDVF